MVMALEAADMAFVVVDMRVVWDADVGVSEEKRGVDDSTVFG